MCQTDGQVRSVGWSLGCTCINYFSVTIYICFACQCQASIHGQLYCLEIFRGIVTNLAVTSRAEINELLRQLKLRFPNSVDVEGIFFQK
jgi:hypothetical protein